MIGKFQLLAIDGEDIETLSRFYAELVGMQRVEEESDEDWIVISAGPEGPTLAFQRVDKLVPPQWPSAERPQQMHVDVEVADLDAAEQQVLELGARKQGFEKDNFRVYLDPAGHPFCLVRS